MSVLLEYRPNPNCRQRMFARIPCLSSVRPTTATSGTRQSCRRSAMRIEITPRRPGWRRTGLDTSRAGTDRPRNGRSAPLHAIPPPARLLSSRLRSTHPGDRRLPLTQSDGLSEQTCNERQFATSTRRVPYRPQSVTASKLVDADDAVLDGAGDQGRLGGSGPPNGGVLRPHSLQVCLHRAR